MQDRYVGDVGDFGKYGLLRSLCRGDEHGAAFRLGVLWYRFDGDASAATNKCQNGQVDVFGRGPEQWSQKRRGRTSRQCRGCGRRGVESEGRWRARQN